MKLKKLNPKKSKAQAMVEFAIVLPVLLLLVYGVIEAGRLLFLYSTVVTASRQAVRYGSAIGIGTDGTERRYQDCDGIRNAAQKAGFLGKFDTITIKWDNGPSTAQTTYCTDPSPTDNSFKPNKLNSSRISVEVIERFTPLVPNLVPFIARDIKASSARTVIVGVTMEVTPLPPPGFDATTTTITTDSPDPSNVGGPVLVTVTVSGGSTPTGTVIITGTDSNCTITLSGGGTGSCNVVFNSGGLKTIAATYGGDATHLGSSDTEDHNVLYSTVVNITAHTPDPSTAGQSVNITVTLTSSGLPIPDGQTIAITGDATCTITLTSGTGNCNVTFAGPTGEKTITATYAGDADHSVSSFTTTHDVIVDKDTITRITSHAPDPSIINQAVTISVKVIGLSTTPTGTVSVSATGTGGGCTITLSGGTGSCTVTFTSIGAKTIQATYGGSANHNASTSSPKGHTVSLQAATITITSHTPDPSAVGGTVTVTVSVTGGATGTVTISSPGITSCTITLPATSCTVVFTSIGTKTLSAAYSGDTVYASSNTTATHTVAGPTPVSSCNNFSAGTIQKSGNTMTVTITNNESFPLTTGAGWVIWNGDKGHQTGSDKTLNLQSITIAGTNVWTGNSSSVSTMPFSNPAVIPAGPITVTIVLTFHQSYDNFDGTEIIHVDLTTPGCEGKFIQAP